MWIRHLLRIFRPNLSLQSGNTIPRTLIQFVPNSAPEGNYTYIGYVGTYPVSILSSDQFAFEKLPGNTTASHNWGWSTFGWDEDNLLPSTSLMIFPYPNPFNKTTQLTFILSESEKISLIIYNVKGQEVARLFEGIHPSGFYQATFDGSNLGSGIYIARLEAGASTATQKLVLLKWESIRFNHTKSGSIAAFYLISEWILQDCIHFRCVFDPYAPWTSKTKK